MRRLDAGSSKPRTHRINVREELLRDAPSLELVRVLSAGHGLRPIQHEALLEARILESRQHLVICAPTNSGKSLVAYVLLLDAVLQHRRAVLIEPLRALAQEQSDQLLDFLRSLPSTILPRVPRVRISTGDYRLDGEMPHSPPPTEGEIIVATPERLDAIMRNPQHCDWASTIGACVVDEGHLIADSRRGPVVEFLIASMLSLRPPPRIALLSATIGKPERLQEWLHPCQIVTSEVRMPLTKEVWELDEGECPDQVLSEALSEFLQIPNSAALVFVYRRDTADTLASKLSSQLHIPVRSYHAGMSIAERALVRHQFLSGSCRCLISTTSLALGVNLPATHVLIRDTTFYGHGRLSTSELLQILGRAGRGDRAGFGAVLLRPDDAWQAAELSQALRHEAIPPLQSSFDSSLKNNRREQAEVEVTVSAATITAICLARAPDLGLERSELSALLGNTLGARGLLLNLDSGLRWLLDPSRAIAYRDEHGRFHLTALGAAGIRAMIPLPYLSGLAQLIRDLISLAPDGSLLARWAGLDHLFVAALMSDRCPSFRRFSESLAGQIDGWIESKPQGEKSLLFAEWVMGAGSTTRADQLSGSLGLTAGSGDIARKRAYLAMLAAAVLADHSAGVPIKTIERRWELSPIDGIEESWRDTLIWLLSGHAAIFEVRNFYHHLREFCSATHEQVRSTKQALVRMRRQTYDLMEELKYCSPLGPLMRGVRATISSSKQPALGIGTIHILEAAGVHTMKQVAAMDFDALVSAGVQRRFAKQIRAYIKRRFA